MRKHTQHVLTTSIVLGVLALGGIAFAYSGLYNIGADDTHTKPVYAVLQTLRQRSIDARAHKQPLPANLNDPARVRQGAGNYDAMCTGCHLGPGMEETELSKGLYPTPPNLATAPVDAAEAFWVIKHGIKASGMPAWGKSMDDEYIWNMAAFLQELPKLNAEQYQALVASSGGHSHGGGETGGHHHDEEGAEDHHHDDEHADADHAHAEGEAEHHHDETESSTPASSAAGTTHVHADGTRHVHAPKAAAAPKPTTSAQPATETKPTPEPATEEHEHDHQH